MKKYNRRIIGVDFDGTLAVTAGTYPKIQAPIQEVIDYVLEEKEKGAFLILITMREGEVLKEAIDWCAERNLKFDAVNDNLPHIIEFFGNNPRKIFCNEYIDNINFGGIDYILQEIQKQREGEENE